MKHNYRQTELSPRPGNPAISIQQWDSMPELQIRCDDVADEGITLNTVNPHIPTELHQFDASLKDPGSSLSSAPFGSEPVKDLRSVSDAEIDDGITFTAANLDRPIELHQFDASLKDPGSSLSSVPFDSEPVKDLRSGSTTLDKGQEDQLSQGESYEETKLLGEKHQDESH